MHADAKGSNSLVVSFLTLRKAIGVLGLLLPFVLLFGALVLFDTGPQRSISAYYHTDMGDVFVGTLTAIGVFLWAYRGYDNRDNLLGYVAGVSAIGVALFPTGPAGDSTGPQTAISIAHFVFGAIFFITLACFSLFLFTKKGEGKPTEQKVKRNVVYRAAGYTILVAIALIPIRNLLPWDLSAYNPVFYLESIAVIAFGVAWLVKGEMILQD